MIVVDDCAKATPTTKAVAAGKPASHVIAPTAAVVTPTCPMPRPSTRWRSLASCGKE